MIAETIPELQGLSTDDKITLAAELWRAAATESGAEADPEMVSALAERLKYFNEHPEETAPWETVRDRIRASKKQ